MAQLKANPFMKTRLSTQRGLTLIEVLVALTIISIAFTAIIISTSQNIRNTQYLENKMIGAWVASNTMNQIRGAILAVPEAEPISGETDTLGQKWFWKANIEPTPNPKIKKVEVQVSQSENGKKIINLTSYLYNEQQK